ncbi:MAG: thiolase family protein [Armatimonadetes bacterium]|nr:thiolase family protein [Armatimonadota bacterium]MDI9584043.1 thiolase family protein [Acidobacteriota bacterium]
MPTTTIIDAVRTPIGRFGGGLLEYSAGGLAALVVQALMERNDIPPDQVDEVFFGQVIQGGSDGNLARKAAIAAGLPVSVCGVTVNMACASGMRAIDMARQAILLGEGRIFIAGGAESMSNAPFYVKDARWGHKLGSITMIDAIMDEGLRCPVTGMGMGETAEEIATRTGITREEMDAWALRSQERARSAIDSGRFADEIIPVPRAKDEPLCVDEHPRDTSLEALAKLKPAFRPDGCVTAGNASGINDGACALLVAEGERAAELGWTPRARVVASAWAGVEPAIMGMGPVDAVRRMCDVGKLQVSDFELVELNEAFAVQALAVMRDLGLDEERVNVNGSGIALGHPIGATGARIVTSLLYEMEKRDLTLGLATLCVGGGMGMAMAIERI